ncbi:MAG: MoaD/ThiS family protein [Deltaproteobacteria bacterium]|nr:MoaD/ThiS family protein [Deltaproteobacteria bacterium]MBI3076973.1 MoaD/ThiS family protein [Deltaproteobacteria bacterium]
MVRLKLMPPLTWLVGEQEIAVDMARAPLKAVLEQAAAQNGKFRTSMLDAEGNLASEYSCLINDKQYNASDLAGIEVKDGDEIAIILPLSGGA